MQLTCYVCNATGGIEAFTKDDAAGEFVALAGSLQPSLWRALQAYIGLFRTSRKLPFDKALKLAKETLALEVVDHPRLEIALTETVEALRAKNGPPLKNHNYLRRVLENTPGSGLDPLGPKGAQGRNLSSESSAPRSKAAQALSALVEWAGNDWLRCRIAYGLSACVAQTLKKQPAAEIITLNADTWYLALKSRLTIEEVDALRLAKGFELLLPTLTEWPQPKQLIELIPNRTKREALRYEPTDENRQQSLERLQELRDKL